MGDWSATFVTAPHDGNNRSEVMRIRNQHPGEPECLQDNRVVGFLGPTRCERFCFYVNVRIGNFVLKQKLVDTRARASSSRRYLAQTTAHLFSARPSQFSSRVERTTTRDLCHPRKKPTICFQRPGRPPHSASKRRVRTTEGRFFNIVLGWTRGFV